MVSADEVPFCLAGCEALDIRRVVLFPGLTGSPSLHMVLATPEARLAAPLIGGFCCSYAAAGSGVRSTPPRTMMAQIALAARLAMATVASRTGLRASRAAMR